MKEPEATPTVERRVLKFRRRPAAAPAAVRPLVDDLSKYERGSEPDDYRHRMLVNAAAFLFVLGLIGAGLWLTETIADLRRHEDCALAGHRDCLQIELGKWR